MDRLEELLFVLETRYNMYKALCGNDHMHPQDDIFEQVRHEIKMIRHGSNKSRRTVKRFKGTEHPYGG